MSRLVSLQLSGRAECAHDVSAIFIKMLRSKKIAPFLSGYACKGLWTPLPDVRFDVAFLAPEANKAAMHAAVKALLKLIEAQDDAHRCLETLAFTDEFCEDAERSVDVGAILSRLDEKTTELMARF